jgi:hypothetical protein
MSKRLIDDFDDFVDLEHELKISPAENTCHRDSLRIGPR